MLFFHFLNNIIFLFKSFFMIFIFSNCFFRKILKILFSDISLLFLNLKLLLLLFLIKLLVIFLLIFCLLCKLFLDLLINSIRYKLWKMDVQLFDESFLSSRHSHQQKWFVLYHFFKTILHHFQFVLNLIICFKFQVFVELKLLSEHIERFRKFSWQNSTQKV